MKKDFNDFMALMNSKDLSLVAKSITETVEGKTPEEAMLLINIYASTTILKEYHEWVNK